MVDVYFDGGTDGLQICIVFDFPANKVILTHTYPESKTNNELEYLAMIAALKQIPSACERGDIVLIKGDSKLVIEQINGHYQVRAEGLIPLYKEAKGLLATLRQLYHIKFEWVPRNENKAGKIIETRQHNKLTPMPKPLLPHEKYIIERINTWNKEAGIESSETVYKLIMIELIAAYIGHALPEVDSKEVFFSKLDKGVRTVCKKWGISIE